MKRIALFVAFNIAIVMISETFAAGRIALVIGNSAYQSSPLINPANDAHIIAKKTAVMYWKS